MKKVITPFNFKNKFKVYDLIDADDIYLCFRANKRPCDIIKISFTFMGPFIKLLDLKGVVFFLSI